MLLMVSMPLSHTCGQTDVQTSSEQRECVADWLASGESKIGSRWNREGFVPDHGHRPGGQPLKQQSCPFRMPD